MEVIIYLTFLRENVNIILNKLYNDGRTKNAKIEVSNVSRKPNTLHDHNFLMPIDKREYLGKLGIHENCCYPRIDEHIHLMICNEDTVSQNRRIRYR